jgi:hypothetical protein
VLTKAIVERRAGFSLGFGFCVRELSSAALEAATIIDATSVAFTISLRTFICFSS